MKCSSSSSTANRATLLRSVRQVQYRTGRAGRPCRCSDKLKLSRSGRGSNQQEAKSAQQRWWEQQEGMKQNGEENGAYCRAPPQR